MSSTTQVIVSALVRRDGRMLLAEEMEPGGAPLERFLCGAPAGPMYVADRT